MSHLPALRTHLPVLRTQTLPIDGTTAVEGQLIDYMTDCAWCGRTHPVINSLVDHCCGDQHDVNICCQCGHHHTGTDCKVTPCGDYRCCVN